jgi:hypothetical protein
VYAKTPSCSEVEGEKNDQEMRLDITTAPHHPQGMETVENFARNRTRTREHGNVALV